jgi:tetratricopeptide (TPR) repeat protein
MAESPFARAERMQAAWSRALRAGTLGLPAVLICALVLITLREGKSRIEYGGVRLRYLQRLQQAVESKRWEAVELLSQKLAELDPHDPLPGYHLALCAESSGDIPRAERLMSRVAETAGESFAPAHWWLAERMARKAAGSDANRLDNVESAEISAGSDHQRTRWLLQLRGHLRVCVKAWPSHAQARALLAQTELNLGQSDQAVAQLLAVADENPALRLIAARILERTGRSDDARSEAARAAEIFRRQLRERPDDVTARLHLVDALVLQHQTAEAGRMLEAGLQLTNDPRLRGAQAQLCVAISDVLERSPTGAADLGRRLELLERALALDPGHPAAMKRVAELVVGDPETAGPARTLLEPCLARGTAPAVVHMLLGTQALAKADYNAARVHFEAAHAQEPELPACLNNLAWTLTQVEPSDLDRALQLIDLAIQQQPERPEFRETRGQILLRLGRTQEAVAELERGLKSDGDVSVTHASLSAAYERLGQTRLADQHRVLRVSAQR